MSRYTLMAVVLASLATGACVQNDPWRSGAIGEFQAPADNTTVYTPGNPADLCGPGDACGKALVEIFRDEQGRDLFEIDYVEFTERGNVFDTDRVEFVMKRLRTYSQDSRGVIAVVFIHGWKHNASAQDENVQDFREVLLRFVQENAFIGRQRVVGIYIGWRGATVSIPVIEELTFWDRKAVAQKIGKGGVTDILLDLEILDAANPRNLLVAVGHSFGGAILLSAYSEQVLSRIKYLAGGKSLRAGIPIADSLILLNPAIEADEMLPTKEAIINNQPWSGTTPNLMRVVSTDADIATHKFFPLGQYLGTVLTWNQEQLYRRSYADYAPGSPQAKFLHERALDITTVGNFLPFHTQEMVRGDASSGSWMFKDLCNGESRQLTTKGDRDAPTFPCGVHDPVQFVYTTKDFMSGHNDIFNGEVSAYVISTIRSALLDSKTDNQGVRVKQSSNAVFEQDFQEIYRKLEATQ